MPDPRTPIPPRPHRVVVALIALTACGTGGTPGGDGAPGDPPHVVSVAPENGATAVPVDTTIQVRFSEPMDPSAGAATCPVPCAASWNEAGDELVLTPERPLEDLADQIVSLAGFRDAAGEALAPFETTFRTDVGERLEPRPRSGDPAAGWRFVELALDAGITEPFEYSGGLSLRPTTAGGAVGDYDGDGFVDVYLGRGDLGTTRLYRNRGDGGFDDVTFAAGVGIDTGTITGPSFVDRDADGDLDLLATTFEGGASHFFVNEGDGTFSDLDPATIGMDTESLPTFSVSWADIDRDRDLDVFFSRFATSDPLDPRFLFLNDGDGTFTEASTAARLFMIDIQQSFTANFGDMDDDGYPELLVASDHGHSVYLRNNADGTFRVDRDVELTDENGMGATVVDYDNDGDLDWFVTAIYDPNGVTDKVWGVLGNRLYQNQGDGHLVDVSEAAGVRDGSWGWGACAQDFDLDGHVDLLHANGWLDLIDIADEEYGKDIPRLFRNRGDGTFEEIAREVGILDTAQGRGIYCFDYDRDGDVDFLTTNYNQRPLLYRNDAATHGHFLNVRLRGLPPNTEGVGARVHVTIGAVTQTRELRAGANYMSNDPVEAHFGLGAASAVDELRVVWPDGTETVVTDVVGDRFVQISQKATP